MFYRVSHGRAALARTARAFATRPSGAAKPVPKLGGVILHDALVENGVKHVFGYSGGANLPVLDAFHASPIKFIMNRSEQCCGHAAEGYAKASGEVGVILTTSGPGASRATCVGALSQPPFRAHAPLRPLSPGMRRPDEHYYAAPGRQGRLGADGRPLGPGAHARSWHGRLPRVRVSRPHASVHKVVVPGGALARGDAEAAQGSGAAQCDAAAWMAGWLVG
jgi:hypothetical protein